MVENWGGMTQWNVQKNWIGNARKFSNVNRML